MHVWMMMIFLCQEDGQLHKTKSKQHKRLQSTLVLWMELTYRASIRSRGEIVNERKVYLEKKGLSDSAIVMKKKGRKRVVKSETKSKALKIMSKDC